MDGHNVFLPGTASLIEESREFLMVSLRDGRKVFGILRTFDQFANVVLQDTVERIYVDDKVGEKKLGLYVIRGENVVLLGQVDRDKDQDLFKNNTLKIIPFDEAKKIFEQEQKEKEEKAKLKKKIMQDRGISFDPYTISGLAEAFDF